MVQNQIKTVLLLGTLTGLLLFVGQLIGGASGLTFALILALLMNFIAYWFSDKIVLFMYRAKEATETEYPVLHRIVAEVANLANLPMPRVYIVPTNSPNAFATGRSPRHAAVACTVGILNLLKEDELKGVISHEISHIKNRDTLIATIAATIAGAITYVATMARWTAMFGGMREERKGSGMIELLVLAVLTPLIAAIIQLAISRSREYLADESAARMLHSGEGLASALEKLNANVAMRPMEFGNRAAASLFIVNPLSGGGILALFSTHPPVKERLRRLRGLHF